MSKSSSGVRDESSPPWVRVSAGIHMRKMVEANGSSIILYRLEAGRRFPLHQHEFAELGVVLGGRGRLLVGDEERPLREGDSYYIPSNAPHGFAVDDEAAVVLMNVTSPVPPVLNGPTYSDVLQIARDATGPSFERPVAPPT